MSGYRFKRFFLSLFTLSLCQGVEKDRYIVVFSPRLGKNLMVKYMSFGFRLLNFSNKIVVTVGGKGWLEKNVQRFLVVIYFGLPCFSYFVTDFPSNHRSLNPIIVV